MKIVDDGPRKWTKTRDDGPGMMDQDQGYWIRDIRPSPGTMDQRRWTKTRDVVPGMMDQDWG